MFVKQGIAKSTCYHPASGLFLAAGETYAIPVEVWSNDVFDEAAGQDQPPVDNEGDT